MKKYIALAATVSVVVAATFVATSGAADTASRLELTGVQTSAKFPNHPRPGSTLVFAGRETGGDSGKSYVHCTVIAGMRALCQGSFDLKRGSVVVVTTLPLAKMPKTFKLAITGGTGAYNGARGTATFTDIGKDKTAEVFEFTS